MRNSDGARMTPMTAKKQPAVFLEQNGAGSFVRRVLGRSNTAREESGRAFDRRASPDRFRSLPSTVDSVPTVGHGEAASRCVAGQHFARTAKGVAACL